MGRFDISLATWPVVMKKKEWGILEMIFGRGELMKREKEEYCNVALQIRQKQPM